MMGRRGFGGMLISGLATLTGGCKLLGSRSSYRFRMTVEVQTPQGMKTGSSVYKGTAYRSTVLTSEEKPGGGGLTGQAITVELPSGPIFVLLKMPRAGRSLQAAATLALAPEARGGDLDDYISAVGKLGGWTGSAKAELPREDWPLMVRFRDLSDPMSVENVSPEAIGVKRIVVETTSDDVTKGIEKRLAWLQRIRGGYLHGGFTSRGAPIGLAGGAFSTELGS